MGGITLHPEKGVNPHITCCKGCGKDIGLALVGINNRVITCGTCGVNNVAAKFGDKCGGCGGRLSSRDKWRELEEHEKIPDGLCDECQEEVEKHKAIVQAGGVYWKCSSCNAKGVIKRSEYSLEVKRAMGLEEDAMCGVMFSKLDCPACSNKAGKE